MMPPFLTTIAAWLGGKVLKLDLALLLAAGLLGGGFVWGDAHATKLALDAGAKDGDARIAALQKNYQAVTSDYLGKLSAENAHGDELAAALATADSRLAANTAEAKEAIAHAVSPNSACDLSAPAIGILRRQPARQ
jgi:hypothetical protein